MQLIESEIERRIELLYSHPVIKHNKWQVHVCCRWLTNGVKILEVTIMTGSRYSDAIIMTVCRDSKDVQEAIYSAFEYITRKLETVEAPAA